jgi:2-polyprenyl-6-methoxyphenol hydroxylase-like FAD-dependent oxidoreductase
MTEFDICIRGTGVVARVLALALSRQGLGVALQGVAATPREQDVRAYALNAASVELLEALKIWQALPAVARTPVLDMRVAGDAVEGASLHFSAWQQTVSELAWIVDVAALESELDVALRYAPHVQRVEAPAAAALMVLAEGRASSTREALGVAFEVHDYRQHAIAARLTTDQPHGGLARQWFRAPDVLALLPMDQPEPGRGLALVWSLPSERAQALLALDDEAFEAELMLASTGAAGQLRLAGARRAWPLALALAERVHGPGWVLVGDAAHLVHPLAGQGLNLGLADAAALTRVLAQRETWRGLGDERLLARYARERAAPTLAMARLTDGLVRLFSHPAPWVKELRNRGLGLVEQAAPIKRWLAARALGH